MEHKLIELIQYIQIGLNRFSIIFIFVFLTSCWSRNYNYRYSVRIHNSTSDTLLLILGKDNEDYYVDSIQILPVGVFTFVGTPGIDKHQNAVRCILNSRNRPFQDQARVYRNDSLKVVWDGPPREMPDSIHHFYNYKSWESWLIDDDEGVVMFTIYESDLKD